MSTRLYFLTLILGTLACVLMPHVLFATLIYPDNGKVLTGTTMIVSPFLKEPIEVSGPASAIISGVAVEVTDWKISVNDRELPVYRHDATVGFHEGVFLLDDVKIQLPATIRSTSAMIKLSSDQTMSVITNADYGKIAWPMSVLFAIVFIVMWSLVYAVSPTAATRT